VVEIVVEAYVHCAYYLNLRVIQMNVTFTSKGLKMKSACSNSACQDAKKRIATLASTLAVGDVLHKVLMWENTANYFYQVVSIDEQTIGIRRLNANSASEFFGYGLESPILNSFADDVITEKDKRWLGEFCKWDGQPAHYTYAN
jgi:hypothetical protein